jgi:hypothetical protein
MDELTLDGKIYLSSKRAAQLTGYAKDYVGQLCREGRVEARLVGRNWYVLESSIREHRFGGGLQKETTKSSENTEKEADSEQNEAAESWRTPAQYMPEPSPELLLLAAEKKTELKEINLIDTAAFAEKTGQNTESPIIQEMQTAWYDWFSRTNGLKISKETLLEDEETIEKRDNSIEEAIFAPEPQKEEEITPIFIEKIRETAPVLPSAPIKTFESYKPEELVPVRRTFAPAASTISQNVPAVTKNTSQQGSIIRERIIRKKKKPSTVLRTLLLALGGVAIAITALGSGEFDSLIGTSIGTIAPLHYLVGESSFEKVSK